MSASKELRAWLNDYYKTKHCTLTGRGASAIYVLLRALNHQGAGVLVPAITCPTVIYAIELAGCHPVFTDINLDDFNIDLSKLDEIEKIKNIKAVLAIHNFGHRLNMKAMRSWCDFRGIFLIEDVCQIMSGSNEEDVGDAVITSFGYSKPIDCGDGGALMLRDMDIVDTVEKELALLPIKPGIKERQEEAYRSVYYGLWELSKRNSNARILFKYLGCSFQDMYLYKISDDICELIINRLPDFESMSVSRVNKTQIYQNAFLDLPVKLPKLCHGSIPWRYTFMVDDPKDQALLTSSLRSKGYNVSNWYPSLSQDWGESSETCINADYFEQRVINLWVDNNVSNETVLSTAEQVINYYG